MGTANNDTEQGDQNQSASYEEEDSDALSTTDDRKKAGKCCPQVNRKLLLPKAFYYCFFSAWGSLLPYLALYFKQLLLTPSQVGILMGLKPFVNFLATPVWGALVDKFHIHRFALVVSLIALITSTFAICLVPGPKQQKTVIKAHCNRTDLADFMELTGQEIDKMVLSGPEEEPDAVSFYFSKSRWPWIMDYLVTNLDEDPVHIKYKIDASSTFTSLFLITLFGTLIASPALALVDTATLQILSKETHRYGKQRLTGSLGWGMGAFIVGASLQTTHRCSLTKNREIVDYIPCFYVFAVLMTLGLVVSVKFTFKTRGKGASGTSLAVGLVALKSPTYVMFLFTALYLGFLMAFIKTFLFWHLKDLGGTQMLFSVISAVNCVAEVSMYFLSEKLIKKIGQIRVLYLGLICYSIRLFYYSVIPYTWMVLAVELLPGITTAAVWAACLSYVSLNSKPGAQTTMQCILHGVHWGLGYGAGEVIGGILVHHYGAPATFVTFGILCIVVLLLYILINMIWGKKDKSTIRDDETQTDLDVNNLPEEDRIIWENAQAKKRGLDQSVESDAPQRLAINDAARGDDDDAMPAIVVDDAIAQETIEGGASKDKETAGEEEKPQASTSTSTAPVEQQQQKSSGTSPEEIELKEKNNDNDNGYDDDDDEPAEDTLVDETSENSKPNEKG
eukprot:gene3020-3478_t